MAYHNRLALLGLFLLFVGVSAAARSSREGDDSNNLLSNIAAGSSLGYATALQLGLPDFEPSNSASASAHRYGLAEKAAFCSFAAACAVMFAHFEGNLTAFMTAEAPPAKINSFQVNMSFPGR